MKHADERARSLRWALAAAAVLPILLAVVVVDGRGPAFAGRPAGTGGDQRVELGRRLFFDPAVSRSGHVSCGSCHDPEHGFSDPRPVSRDDDFKNTRRHSSTLVDCAPSPAMHWDGEFATVAQLVVARLGSRQEFEREIRRPRADLPQKRLDRRLRSRYARKNRSNVASGQPVADTVARSGRYDASTRAVYGSPALTTARIAEAIDAYVATIKSTPGPYDRYIAGEADALSAAAERGLQLFNGRAGCARCHVAAGQHPTFTDYAFHDTGVSFRAAKKLLVGRKGKLLTRGRERIARTVMGGRTPALDGGRVEISGDGRDLARFKTPSLRDVALRPPYMHDGSFGSLEAVVRYYASGATKEDPNLDKGIHAFEASDRDVADLVAFLESLTGDVRPGRAPTAWHARPGRMRVGFVDLAGRALAGVPVRIRGAGDTLPGTPDERLEQPLVTDARGWIEFRPPLHTHARVVLPGDLQLPGGNLLPDTVRDVRFVVPVAGRARVNLRLPAGTAAPAEIVLAGRAGSVNALRESIAGGSATYGVWLQEGAAAGRVALCCETELGLAGTSEICLEPGRVSYVDLRD